MNSQWFVGAFRLRKSVFRRASRRGYSLMEMLVAIAISGVVLTAGYQIYASSLRIQDVEGARERTMLAVQNAMGRIKSDVRAASSVQVDGGELHIDGGNGLITYRNKPGGAGVERVMGRSHLVFKDVTARFSAGTGARGVSVDLKSSIRVHRRPIRIEISSFVSPRNL